MLLLDIILSFIRIHSDIVVLSRIRFFLVLYKLFIIYFNVLNKICSILSFNVKKLHVYLTH